MRIVIDASNIISGGGLTHLKEFIRHANPKEYGFYSVILWSSTKTLDRIEDKEWLTKCSHSYLNKGYNHRFMWKHFVLKPTLSENDILFIPGTGYLNTKAKVVTMCRNLLPLEKKEINRYPFGKAKLRLYLLRLFHLRSYTKSNGVIFLNKYCTDRVLEQVDIDSKTLAIIPHGLNRNFFYKRKNFDVYGTFNLLYVSSIDFYKHQWVVSAAVAQLNKEGYDVKLTLIGHAYNSAEKKIYESVKKHPVLEKKMDWLGVVKYEDLADFYKSSDGFIYSSTCETFGMTLLEAMASSLPISCSNMSSMKELLKDSGIYFNPISIESCKKSIIRMVEDKDLRKELGNKAYQAAKIYSWEKCSEQTFSFLRDFRK